MTETTIDRPAERLGEELLLEMFYTMLLSRRLDERSWLLHRQGKIPFHISAIGHEAAQVGAALTLNRGVDYVNPYYRDLTLCLALGMTPTEFMLSLWSRAADVTSGGRQMPSHFSKKDLNIISGSSVVATQVPQTAGLAYAIKYRQANGLVDPQDTTQPRLALTCLGEGSTSQGEWHEGMNWAGVHKLPFICLVQNNEYAISVPSRQQMAVPNVADRAAAYGVEGVVVDGTDPVATYEVMKKAVERAYNGDGPTLVEAKVMRMTPHSSDDDDRTYRTPEELEEMKANDPLLRFQRRLLDLGVLDEDRLQTYEQRVRQEVDEAHKTAEAMPQSPPEAALGAVYAPEEGC